MANITRKPRWTDEDLLRVVQLLIEDRLDAANNALNRVSEGAGGMITHQCQQGGSIYWRDIIRTLQWLGHGLPKASKLAAMLVRDKREE